MEERTYLSGTSLAGMSPTRSRVENDYYATPFEATEAILSREELHGSILEPAAGEGHISKVLREHYPNSQIIVTKFEYKPLRSFTADDIKLLRLDYASQDDPQLLMEEYLPIKNFELLYSWWKQHYKATLKDCDNPQAIILHLAPTD